MNLNSIKFNKKSVKNPVRTSEITIDCEYQHPVTKVWLPFTATPNDEYQHGRDAYEYFKSQGI